MIRPLRSRHRWMIAGIGLVVGALMVLGLLARRPAPTVETLPVTRGGGIEQEGTVP